MRWLHLSDIHFDYTNYDTAILRDKLLDVLISEKPFDFALITGDCFFKGRQGQPINGEDIVSYLKKLYKTCGFDKKRIYICMGNHDIDLETDKARVSAIDKIIAQKKYPYTINKEDAALLRKSNGVSLFSNFYRIITSRSYNYDNSASLFVLNKKQLKARIISINTCLLYNGQNLLENEQPYLTILLDELPKINKNDEHLNMVIMHHGTEYLEEENNKRFQQWLEDNNIDIVFCGHAHRVGLKTLDEHTERDIKQFVSGNVSINQDEKQAIPSFFICDKDDTTSKITIKLYIYSSESGEWVVGNHVMRKFRDGTYVYDIQRLQEFMSSPISEKAEKKNTPIDDSITAKCIGNFIKEMDDKFRKAYGSEIETFLADKKAHFSSNILLKSLLLSGIPFETSIHIVENAISSMVDKKKSLHGMSTETIRENIYFSIRGYSKDGVTQQQINSWAGKYARRYGYTQPPRYLISSDCEPTQATFQEVDKILHELFTISTDGKYSYTDIPSEERTCMREEIMDFIQGYDVYNIDKKLVKLYVRELAQKPPHPWVMTSESKDHILKYHMETMENHLLTIKNDSDLKILYTELLYHSTALLLGISFPIFGYRDKYPLDVLYRTFIDSSKPEIGVMKDDELNNFNMYLLKCSICSKSLLQLVSYFHSGCITGDWDKDYLVKIQTWCNIAKSVYSAYTSS
jgi:predicted phosphodiesterase